MNKLFLLLWCLLLFSGSCFAQEKSDDFLAETLSETNIEQPKVITNYDYSETDCVTIPLRITEKITTSLKNKSHEGQILKFKVDRDVYYNHEKLVARNEIVTARLEIMTTRGLCGIPAEIFITDFNIPGLDNNKIMEPVSKRGISTTELIIPIKAVLTPFPPFGSISNVLVGFNASLTPKQVIKIHYYPNFEIKSN